MKNTFALALLVLAFSIVGAAYQNEKPLNVALEQIQRVEILYFPERILVRAALSPEELEQRYTYKLEIRNVRDSIQWEQLRSVLRETSLTPGVAGHDHRTAVLLFDQNGRRIASVYFAQFGRGGTMNGNSGVIAGGLYQWAKSLLKGVAE